MLLCNQSLELFSSFTPEILHPLSNSSLLSAPPAAGNDRSFWLSEFGYSLSGIIPYLYFSDRLISLNTVSSRYIIHVIVWDRFSFVFKSEWYIPLYTSTTLQMSVDIWIAYTFWLLCLYKIGCKNISLRPCFQLFWLLFVSLNSAFGRAETLNLITSNLSFFFFYGL